MSDIEKVDLNSMDIVENKKQELKKYFPEAFTEGNKINFEKLKLTLGEDIDTGKERYGMNWPGKTDCFKIIQQPSIATLVPAIDESIDFNTTENLFIEGDNLEVLKLLQKSYFGKIKMIYIDPPYNTGNDFIYPDDYSETLDTYLKYTGQIDSEGRKYSTNVESDGRFHSKWMNMMYPRLFLARNLLRDDGVIFISIDDNEVANLRKMCDEIFGEENFVAQLVWRKKAGGGSDSKYFAIEYEYILCYLKDRGTLCSFDIPYNEKEKERFSLEDKRAKYYLKTLERPERLGPRPNLRYPITCPDNTKIEYKENDKKYTWVVSESRFNEMKNNDEIVFNKGRDGAWRVYRKVYMESQTPRGLFYDLALNRDATQEMKQIFNNTEYFSNPKPTALIRFLIHIITNQERSGIILDFFAGSCTTAHAVLNLNKEDGGNRKFICVQLPEPTDENSEAYKAGYRTIADIGKERIRRVIGKMKEEKDTTNSLFPNKESQLNSGFKVFKLQPSNFKIWDANVSKEKEEIKKQLQLHIDHINHTRTQEAILYEILLKSGFTPTTKINTITLAGKTVYSIEEGMMLICLEKELTAEVIKAIAEMKPSRVVCLDEAFHDNDQLKTNAVQIMKSKKIDKFYTV